MAEGRDSATFHAGPEGTGIAPAGAARIAAREPANRLLGAASSGSPPRSRVMAEPVLCKSTRYGEGCGHPVNDHVGEGPCCCCNGQQNSTEHVADCARCWVVHYKWRHPEPITAGDLAAVMPEHLSRSFWRLAVERYMRENLPPAAPALPKEGDSE